MCHYVGVEDPTQESTEELEDDAIVMQMARLVGEGVMVVAECTVVAFSASHHLDLLTLPFLCFSLCLWSASGG